LVGTIELLRCRGQNPDVPPWLAPRYRAALARLAELARDDLRDSDDPLVIRSALGVVAITKNLREHGTILIEFDDSEVEEIVSKWGRGGA
jgi:hypothetical protein